MTVDLYRREGGAPATLPDLAYTNEGFSRTDLANQPESRAELGFVFFATIDPERERVVRKGDGYAVEILPPEPAPVLATSVTRRQAKRALLDARLLQAANEAIATMPGEDGERARIDWADASVFERADPLIAQLGTQLGLDEAAIDALFAAAARIV